MKMLYYSRWHSVLIILLGMSALSACVNEEYDLSEDIDTQITILKNVSLPVGSVDAVTISKVLSLGDDEESVIRKDENGDFIFSFTGDEISAGIEVPSISIAPAGGIHTEPIEVHFNSGSAAGKDPATQIGNIVYSDIAGKPVEAGMNIEIDSQLPSQISDVRSVMLDASIYMNFSVNEGSVHMMKGLTIEFPDYMNVSKSSYSDSRFEIQDNHKLVAKEDIRFSAASPAAFAVKIDKINVPAGAISNGHLVMTDDVRISGDFYLSPSDFTVIPEKILISIKADITDLDVLSSEVKLAVDEKVAGSTVSITELPDFLTGGNVCLDIYNPSMKFEINNDTPIDLSVKAGIKAVRGNKTAEMALGADPAISIPAKSEVKFQVTRRETSVPQGVANVVVPEIGNLISILPETVSFDDIELKSTSSGYMSVVSGEKYNALLSYEVYAPLAFDKDLKIEFTQDIKDINLAFDDVSVENFKISLKIENSIPLDFVINAAALDSDGNVNNDQELVVSGPVKGGTQNSPAVSDIDLTIRSASGAFGLSALRLTMTATSPSDLAGVALNENQGFKITDLVITCPEGITLNNSEK